MRIKAGKTPRVVDKPQTKREIKGNNTRSKVRFRVEHIFGSQKNDMGETLVRSIGLVRTKINISLKSLTYNMRLHDST